MLRYTVKLIVATGMCFALLCSGLVAFATDEGSGTSGTQGIQVSVPGIHWLGWDNNPADDQGETVYFNLTEQEITVDHQAIRDSSQLLSTRSNYDDVSLKCIGPNEWDSVGDGNGIFNLWIDWGEGFREFPLAGSFRWILEHVHTGVDQDWSLSYMLTGLDISDEPDTYDCTVQFILYRY